MTLPLFTESKVCASRAHCVTCRDREGGRRFRGNLNGFTLPADAPDFVCPHGVPWGFGGWTPDQKPRGIGDVVAKITHAVGIKPCGGCGKRQAALNRLVPFRKPPAS